MIPLKDPALRPRRQYDPTFKREAVQNWLKSGKSAEAIARELGIDSRRLFTWRRILFGPTAPAEATTQSVASTDDLQTQLDAARREMRIPMKADTCSDSYRTLIRRYRTVVGAKRRSEVSNKELSDMRQENRT